MIDTVMKRVQQGQFTLVAEIGVNYYDVAEKLHISLMEAAKFMILEAKNAGIHAVKFQSYKADTLAAKNSPSYWDTSEETTTSQYELFRKFDAFGKEDYRELSGFCDSIQIEFLSTPFDFASADYLEPMMNIYKISSSDLSNLPFIEYMAKKNHPIMLSVGASDEEEIDRAVALIRRSTQASLMLLHCVLEYPTPYEHANLRKIIALKKRYPDVYIGYSDHTRPDDGCDVIKTAYLMGATVVEKHFTVDKTLRGNDHYHAMDGHDAQKMIAGIAFLERIAGDETLTHLASEQAARQNARRSIVAAVDILPGQKITREMLTFKRPGHGIAPAEIERVLGKTVKEMIAEDTMILPGMIVSY